MPTSKLIYAYLLSSFLKPEAFFLKIKELFTDNPLSLCMTKYKCECSNSQINSVGYSQNSQFSDLFWNSQL